MKKPLIFNIQRYSIHDGGGIRTMIFFKGCPLRCPWCSNPESQETGVEIIRKNSLCIQCIAKDAYTCPAKPEDCPTGALEYVGRSMSIEEILKEVKKDMVFYDTSAGGVTLSGGEVLLHGEFAAELLKEIKDLGIHTAIETTGHGSWQLLDKMTDYTDLVLFDFKIMDKEKFAEIIKGDLDLVLDNFDKLMKKDVKVIPRVPLIPGYTMNQENIEKMIEILKKYPKIDEVHLLPFHQFGSSKYKGIGKEYTMEGVSPPEDDVVEDIKKVFEKEGFTVYIGGR